MTIGQLTNNFHIDEFRCNDKKKTPVPPKYILNVLLLAHNLQALRTYLNAPISINSGYRTWHYNKYIVKGASKSKHLTAQAADIVVKGYTSVEVKMAIEHLISVGKMTEGGLKSYDSQSFTHYDVRGTKARW